MATAQAQVTVPQPIGTTNWTLIYTATGTYTLNIHNRTPSMGMRIRVNGSSGAVTDALTSPYEVLMPFASMQMPLVSGDLVYATPNDVGVPGAAAASGTVIVR
jgi:hypothetical protein